MVYALLLALTVPVLAYAFYKWATKHKQYFKKRNLAHLKPHFLIGNNGGLFLNKYTAPEYFIELYNNFPDQRYVKYFQFSNYLLNKDFVCLIQNTQNLWNVRLPKAGVYCS